MTEAVVEVARIILIDKSWIKIIQIRMIFIYIGRSRDKEFLIAIVTNIYMFSSSKGLQLFINVKKSPVLPVYTPVLK